MSIKETMLLGEEQAIEMMKWVAAQYGYGDMIYHLKNAWSEYLQADGMTEDAADRAAFHVCPWCNVDGRTGKKA
jgi:hypothetical protein